MLDIFQCYIVKTLSSVAYRAQLVGCWKPATHVSKYKNWLEQLNKILLDSITVYPTLFSITTNWIRRYKITYSSYYPPPCIAAD